LTIRRRRKLRRPFPVQYAGSTGILHGEVLEQLSASNATVGNSSGMVKPDPHSYFNNRTLVVCAAEEELFLAHNGTISITFSKIASVLFAGHLDLFVTLAVDFARPLPRIISNKCHWAAAYEF
jgi:hypothetical protein